MYCRMNVLAAHVSIGSDGKSGLDLAATGATPEFGFQRGRFLH